MNEKKMNPAHWDLMMYFKLDLLILCVSPNEHWHHTVFQPLSPCWTRRKHLDVRQRLSSGVCGCSGAPGWGHGGNLRSQMCFVARRARWRSGL